MGSFYPLALESFEKAEIDVTDTTFTVQAYTNAVTFNTAHQFLDDLDAGEALGDPFPLTTVTVTGGLIDADPATLANVNNGDIIGVLVFYMDTGSPATSRLVIWENKRSDNTTLSFTGTGSPLTADFPSGIGSI